MDSEVWQSHKQSSVLERFRGAMTRPTSPACSRRGATTSRCLRPRRTDWCSRALPWSARKKHRAPRIRHARAGICVTVSVSLDHTRINPSLTAASPRLPRSAAALVCRVRLAVAVDVAEAVAGGACLVRADRVPRRVAAEGIERADADAARCIGASGRRACQRAKRICTLPLPNPQPVSVAEQAICVPPVAV
jgi:hypothetical protein